MAILKKTRVPWYRDRAIIGAFVMGLLANAMNWLVVAILGIGR